jgi:hypothetical protein
MTGHYIDANLTVIITEARSNVGNISNPGEMGVRPNTLYTPPIFPQLWIYFMIKMAKVSSETVSTEHPQKMHS